MVVNGAKANDTAVADRGHSLADGQPTPDVWKTGDGSVVDVAPHTWEAIFAVNVFAAAAVCRAAIPTMVDRGGGSIVNISSRAAERGTPGLAAYSSSKSALHALTRSIAVDFGKAGVRSNAIAAGFVEHAERDVEMLPERRAFFEGQHLTPRLGLPDDVAALVVYLASSESAFMTGEVLFLDGGGASSRGRVVG